MLKAISSVAISVIAAITEGLVRFTGPTAGNTRTITVPDANATMARTDAAQTFTGTQTISGNGAGLNFTGGNNRINFNSNRAVEGATDASLLTIGESYSATSIPSNLIHAAKAAAPSLTTNRTMTYELTNDTTLKLFVRGADGTTRSVSLTLS